MEKNKRVTSTGIWDRHATSADDDMLSKRVFISLVCVWSLFGLGMSAWAAFICRHMTFNWVELLLLIALAFVGVFVAARGRSNPVWSLLGYAMIALPFGALLGAVVALYTTGSVLKVLCITGSLTIGLGVLGAIYPRSLESWSSWLFGALLVLIFGNFFTLFAGAIGIPIQGALTVWDWIGVFLFAGFIIFDLNRAMRVERTMSNAIMCAVEIYLDVLNIFVRLLSLLGRKD